MSRITPCKNLFTVTLIIVIILPASAQNRKASRFGIDPERLTRIFLVEEGRLALNDPVEKYIPQYGTTTWHEQGRAIQITIHHLLTHTAGLPFFRLPEIEDITIKRDRTLSEVVDFLAKQKPEFEPGIQFRYSLWQWRGRRLNEEHASFTTARVCFRVDLRPRVLAAKSDGTEDDAITDSIGHAGNFATSYGQDR